MSDQEAKERIEEIERRMKADARAASDYLARITFDDEFREAEWQKCVESDPLAREVAEGKRSYQSYIWQRLSEMGPYR